MFALADWLGLHIDLPAPGKAVARLEADERHQNPFGFVHGATVFAMVDTAMGAAVMSVVSEGERCATQDIQLRFLRSVRTGPIEAVIEVTSQRPRRVVLTAFVTREDGELVATATGDFAVQQPL